MESPRERSVHKMLGGGLLADVILWRRRHVTVGIVIGTFAAWVVFELSRYTLLWLVSRVLLLLVAILFAWAKAAGVLNRCSRIIYCRTVWRSMSNLSSNLDFVEETFGPLLLLINRWHIITKWSYSTQTMNKWGTTEG